MAKDRGPIRSGGAHPGTMSGPCWDHVGAMLGTCRDHGGAMLGPCREVEVEGGDVGCVGVLILVLRSSIALGPIQEASVNDEARDALLTYGGNVCSTTRSEPEQYDGE